MDNIMNFNQFIQDCYEETAYSYLFKRYGQDCNCMPKLKMPEGGWASPDDVRKELGKIVKLLTAMGIDIHLFKGENGNEYTLTTYGRELFHWLLYFIKDDELSAIRKKKFYLVSPTTLVHIRTHYKMALDELGVQREHIFQLLDQFDLHTGCPPRLFDYNSSTLIDEAKANMIRSIASTESLDNLFKYFSIKDDLLPIPDDKYRWELLFNAMVDDYKKVSGTFINKWAHYAKEFFEMQISLEDYCQKLHDMIDTP